MVKVESPIVLKNYKYYITVVMYIVSVMYTYSAVKEEFLELIPFLRYERRNGF